MKNPIRIAALVAILTLSLAVPAAAGTTTKTVRDPDGLGALLATKFLTLLEAKDTAGLNRFLAPEFQLQRSNGTRATKSEYLANLPALANSSIANVRATAVYPVLVVTYTTTTTQTIDGQPFSTAPAPRLSVFEKTGRNWRLVAHANFNIPQAGT